MTILVVDNSAADRQFCRRLLEERYGRDLELHEAANGLKALKLCDAKPPDCIFLDSQLPDLTPVEFLTHIQPAAPAGSPGAGITAFAVVILTRRGDERVAVDAIRAGAQDFLVKDFMTSETLHLAVTKATEKIALIRALQDERDRLAASLAEKEVLLQEVHHRVKNNLQVIVSLLRMQALNIRDESAARALRDSRNRVESMALIHEQLYQSNDLREVDLPSQITTLTASLIQSYAVDPARITWRVSIEPMRLAVDRAIPVGLILNELISNALQHAFPDARRGVLTISGGPRGEEVVLEVRDDGVGLPARIRPESAQSLGLQIIRVLTRQVKGSLEWAIGPTGNADQPADRTDSAAGVRKPGTAVRLTFPSGSSIPPNPPSYEVPGPGSTPKENHGNKKIQTAGGGR